MPTFNKVAAYCFALVYWSVLVRLDQMVSDQ